MVGPFSKTEMHWSSFKVLTVRLNPNKAARIIMYLFWPQDNKFRDGVVMRG